MSTHNPVQVDWAKTWQAWSLAPFFKLEPLFSGSKKALCPHNVLAFLHTTRLYLPTRPGPLITATSKSCSLLPEPLADLHSTPYSRFPLHWRRVIWHMCYLYVSHCRYSSIKVWIGVNFFYRVREEVRKRSWRELISEEVRRFLELWVLKKIDFSFYLWAW